MSRRLSLAPGLITFGCFASLFVLGGACSSDPDIVDSGSDSGKDSGSDSGKDSGSDSGNDSGADSGSDGVDSGWGGNGSDSGSDGGGPVCETASSEAELQPIFLAFAFDVSGSMGQLDYPRWWHDPVRKWDPVVAATTEFFEDENSVGISASMKLFPADAGESTRCAASTYDDPDDPEGDGVAMTALPSSDFRTILTDYRAPTLIDSSNWRGGTPTLAVVQGTIAFLEPLIEEHPEAKVALVLVTDGYPQGCSDASIGAVANAVAGVNATIPTYVIGVQNPTTTPQQSDPLPPGWARWGCNASGQQSGSNAERIYPCPAPDTLDDLHDIAEAGGTEAAFLIDTDNPAATKAAFRAAIDAIRARAISCELGIPPHPTPGKTFEKDKINVSLTVGDTKTEFFYNPDCSGDDSDSWRYDDEDDPKQIVLCNTTCQEVQATPGADLNVDFLCESRPIIPR